MIDLQVKPQLDNSTRYKQLDSLRGLAAVAVFVSHYLGVFKNKTFLYNVVAKSPFGVLFNGHAAVIFFFILSGFVLSLPFINKKERPLKLIEFYVKRVFRIYPAYIVVLCIALGLKFFLFDPGKMSPFSDWLRTFWNWNWTADNIKQIVRAFMLIGPKFNHDLIDPATWSLVVEMRMSLFLPFFILIVSKANFNFNVLFFLVLNVIVYNGALEYLGIFYIGIFLAKYKDTLIAKFRHIPFVPTIALGVGALMLYNSNYEYLQLEPTVNEHFKYFLRDYVIAAGSCIIIIIAITKISLTSFLEKKPFIFVGDISYSFYLLHMPLLFTVSSMFSNTLPYGYVYIFLTTFIVGVVLSRLIYNYVEIPFQKFAKQLLKRVPVLNYLNINS